jgi:hypothetical protein
MVPNSRLEASADGVQTYVGLIWFRTFVAVLVRPWLWWTALRHWFRLVPAQWWRRAPFLPVPPQAYVRFRLETAYGPRGRLRPCDAIDYLEWCRRVEPPRKPA